MWYPYQPISDEVLNFILAALNNDKIKSELSKQIRTEVETQTKSKNNTPTYDSITSGNVNLQTKMAVSGYDVYGRTIVTSNGSSYTNNNVYKKMKNRIKYSKSPQNGYENRGRFTVV